MDPLAAMSAAVQASKRLRVLSLVLLNDLRHPVMVQRAVETIDRLSGGRVELGLGAGWRKEDFEVLGLPFDPPSIRIERLAESVELIDRLFTTGEVRFEGVHYQVHRRAAEPPIAERPRPPILIGGGGRRVLELAARTADIIGVHAALPNGRLGAETVADFGADRMAAKVGWIESALTSAGRPTDAIELQFSVYLCKIGRNGRANQRVMSTFADHLAVREDLVSDSPSVLIGSLDECVERLEARRARFGFSYLRLSDDLDAVAPIVKRLAGR